jgi:peptidoglycan/LPS O-acetylase OafA/YrhL
LLVRDLSLAIALALKPLAISTKATRDQSQDTDALSSNVSFASLPLFLPTIISEMGAFSQIQSNGLSAPPYLLCFFVIILLCWLSDRYKMRGPFVALAASLAAIGFIINATTTGAAPRYFSTFLSVLIFASVALLLAWTANIHASESKRSGGYVILGLIGQCGPLLGQYTFSRSFSNSVGCVSSQAVRAFLFSFRTPILI